MARAEPRIPNHRTGLEPVGDLHRACGLGEPLGKGVMDAILHQNPVGADAGLTGVAVFRSDGKLDRHLMSASSNTMNGALPPNSTDNFLTVAVCPPSTGHWPTIWC
jgi:hypothetical protein